MEDCKYRLPCGRCEKLGAPCDAPKECKHDWERINFTMTNDDIIFHSKCRKCSVLKDEHMKQLFEDINVSTELVIPEKCNHDWNVVGTVAGTKAQYRVYICSKCKAQRTEKTVKDEDCSCRVYLIEEIGN